MSQSTESYSASAFATALPPFAVLEGVKVKIKIERSEEYGTQNRVSDYVKGNDAKASKTQGPDDIPF